MLRLKKAFILEGDVSPARSWGVCLQWTGRKLCQCPSNAKVFCTKMGKYFCLFLNMVKMLCFCSKEGGAKLPSGRTVSGDGGWLSKV